MIVGSSPEPAVHVDRSQVRGVAALVLKVAFPAAGVDRGDVVCKQNISWGYEEEIFMFMLMIINAVFL